MVFPTEVVAVHPIASLGAVPNPPRHLFLCLDYAVAVTSWLGSGAAPVEKLVLSCDFGAATYE